MLTLPRTYQQQSVALRIEDAAVHSLRQQALWHWAFCCLKIAPHMLKWVTACWTNQGVLFCLQTDGIIVQQNGQLDILEERPSVERACFVWSLVRPACIPVQAAPFDALDRLWFGRPASSPAGFSHTPTPPRTRLPHIAHLDLHRRSRLHPKGSPISSLQLSAPSTPTIMTLAQPPSPPYTSLSDGTPGHMRSASLPIASSSPLAQMPSSPCSTPGWRSNVSSAHSWQGETRVDEVAPPLHFQGFRLCIHGLLTGCRPLQDMTHWLHSRRGCRGFKDHCW